MVRRIANSAGGGALTQLNRHTCGAYTPREGDAIRVPLKNRLDQCRQKKQQRQLTGVRHGRHSVDLIGASIHRGPPADGLVPGDPVTVISVKSDERGEMMGREDYPQRPSFYTVFTPSGVNPAIRVPGLFYTERSFANLKQ